MFKNSNKTISLILVLCFIISLIPMANIYAATKELKTTNGKLEVEAESLSFNEEHFKIKEDPNLSKGKGLATFNEGKETPPPATPGDIDLSFTADRAGTYSVWVLANAANQYGYIFVSVNNDPYKSKTLIPAEEETNWTKIAEATAATDGAKISVRIIRRMVKKIVLDKFVITNDVTFNPVKTNGAAATPTPSATPKPSATPIPAVSAEEAKIFDNMRDRWRELLIGDGAVDMSNQYMANAVKDIEGKAQEIWSGMNKDNNRTFLFPDNNFADGKSSNVSRTFSRLNTMAMAYAVNGSSLKGNEQLKGDIINGLEWMHKNKFNENIPEYDNWWDWEIGAAGALNNTLILMFSDFTQEQINKYMSALEFYCPNSRAQYKDGANRVWYCRGVAVRGVLTKNKVAVAAARDGLSDTLPYVTVGNGFYRDGSFIHHENFAYNGGYGINMVDDLPLVMALLKDTPWQVTNPEANNVSKWVYDGYEPFMINGIFMDMVRGREISRSSAPDYATAARALGGILNVIDAAPAVDAAYFKSMVKQLILDDASEAFYKTASLSKLVKAKVIMEDDTIIPRGSLSKYKQYSAIDRAVMQRPNYALGISMHSTRMKNYESFGYGTPEGENLKGWHTGDGMLYVYTKDSKQFNGGYWPTVNNYRLPGTTVEQSTEVKPNIQSDSNWAGGTDLDGTYGVTGMLLRPFGYTIEAKKSWFMFDNEVVALGSGIKASGDKNVETIIENRKLSSAGNDSFMVNGVEKTNSNGWTENMNGVNWAHLSSAGSGLGIGYYFPNPAEVKGLREERTGSWKELNGGDSEIEIKNNYLALWFDHGKNPINGTYSYVILPEMSRTQLKNYATNPNITVLENSENVQAVLHKRLNIIGANFWTDTEQSVFAYGKDSYLKSNMKASVMVKTTKDEIKLSVSDPTQANKSTIQITLNESAESIISKDDKIEVVSLKPAVVLNVNVSGAAGSAMKIALKKTPSEKQDPVKVDEISVYVNNIKVTFDQKPVIENDRTLVPLRAIFESLGSAIEWDDATQTVTAVRGNTTIKLQVGSKELIKNTEVITLDVAAILLNDRVLVPVRAIAESFGAKVDWDDDTQTVTIEQY